MPKRKQTSNGELKNSQISLSIHRYAIPGFEQLALTHWGLRDAQPYFPPIEKLFKSSDLESVSSYGIKFTDEISSIIDENKIRTVNGSIQEIHRKTTMLLSPYKWMRGEYGSTLGLPSSLEQATSAMSKIQNPNNAAYVGAIISSVLSESGCVHFPKIYGVFTGTTTNHTIDISDDYGELCDRRWFSQNIGKMFHIKLSDEIQESSEFTHTRTTRLAIQLGETTELGETKHLDTPLIDEPQMADIDNVVRSIDETDDNESDSSSVSTSYVFEVRSCSCGDESENDDESYEAFAWATFKDVPVQTTLMEKCSGTLYELLMLNPETDKHLAWISQVIFALAYAQRNFALTHNDLHANNVMYVPSNNEFYYYNCGGVIYRVPTYGYTIKIIDFERGISSIKLVGMKEPKLFMSDHFCLEEEAGGQYNYGDYYVTKHPEIKPSSSFDLVRLATSLYWDLFPEPQPDNLLYKFFKRWLTLDDETSVLFGKKDVEHDRYHGFHLYKAIARFCKDNAVPRKEIILLKDVYGVETSEGNFVLSID